MPRRVRHLAGLQIYPIVLHGGCYGKTHAIDFFRDAPGSSQIRLFCPRPAYALEFRLSAVAARPAVQS